MSSEFIKLNKPIFLLGFICSGKTTLGKALAAELNVGFIDTDQFIEKKLGVSVSEIFESKGEAYFRKAEAQALNEIIRLSKNEPAVVALGGGTPCRDGVVEMLNKHGVAVFLDAPVPKLIERIMLFGNTRPAFAGKNHNEVNQILAPMLEQRIPFYQKARYVFDSSRLEDDFQIADSVKLFVETILSSDIRARNNE